MPSGVEFPANTRATFLEALGQTGKVSGPGGAAELVGVAVPTLYAWRDDPEFAAAWDAAIAAQTTVLAESGLTAIREIIADEFHKDRFSASKFAVERAENRALKLEVHGSGEIKFVIETAFPGVIEDGEYTEDDGDTSPAALPGEPETA